MLSTMSVIIHETRICIVSTYVVLGSTDRTSETRIIDPVRLIRGLRITRFSTSPRDQDIARLY